VDNRVAVLFFEAIATAWVLVAVRAVMLAPRSTKARPPRIVPDDGSGGRKSTPR